MKQIRRSEFGGDSWETRETLPDGNAVERTCRNTTHEIKSQKSNHTRIVIGVIDYPPRVSCQPETSQIFHQSQKQSPHCGKNDGNFFLARPLSMMRVARESDRRKKHQSGAALSSLSLRERVRARASWSSARPSPRPSPRRRGRSRPLPRS
jgi:hypothetical protein